MRIIKKIQRGVDMNKKIGVSILLGVLILICVVGMTKGVADSENNTDMLGNASIVLWGDSYGYDNTTKGGESEIVNLTINYGLADGQENITNITISWSGNYTFDGWVDPSDNYLGACTSVDGGDCNPNNDEGNQTFWNITVNMYGTVGDWNCTNLTTTILNCWNLSETSALGHSNNTITLRFNVTAASNIEDQNVWTASVNGTEPNIGNVTTVNTYVDGLAPRLFDLNISDGNMTYLNGSFSGINKTEEYYTYLDAYTATTVTATFYELSPNIANDMKLYYNASYGAASMDNSYSPKGIYTDLTIANATIIAPNSCVRGPLSTNDWAGYAIPIKCTWTIPAGVANDLSNETVIFGFTVNDTFNQATTINDTWYDDGDVPFSFLTNNTLPRLNHINVTDQFGNTRTTLDGTEFLGEETTIMFEVTGGPRAASNQTYLAGYVQIYYNVSGTGGLSINTGSLFADNGEIGGVVENYDDIVNVTDGTYNVTLGDCYENVTKTAYTSLYSVPLYGTGNNTDTIEFAIVIGNTSMDNYNGNYTTTSRAYSFKVDLEAPTITAVTRVTEGAGITQYDSAGVEYKCEVSDGNLSGIQKYVWYLKKPTKDYEEISTHTVSTVSDTITFSSTNLNELGDHLVKCVVYDNVGNYDYNDPNGVTTTEGFTVNAAGAGGVSAAAPGGTPTITFDVDFSTANEGTLKAQQGRIKSFSFDGVTKHTITFVTVTETSATLKIESTPVTITLKTGETKDVDVNIDGVNDISVKLNNILNSVADVTIKKIEEGAAKIVGEEEAARGVERGEEVTPPSVPVEKAGLTWLWWLIAIVIIVALGYYFFFRKKK